MKNLNILVVDDEPGIRELIKDVLTPQGHNVLCAENGVEALSLLSANSVDIVYLDIRMPNGDGLTALKKMMEMRPSLPVIVITGNGYRNIVDQTMEFGAAACLLKPFGIGDVLGMLEVLKAA